MPALHHVALATAAVLGDARVSSMVHHVRTSAGDPHAATALQSAVVLLHSQGACDECTLLLVPLAGLPAPHGGFKAACALPGAWLVDVSWRLQAALHASADRVAEDTVDKLDAWWGDQDEPHAASLVNAVVYPLRKRIMAAAERGMACL